MKRSVFYDVDDLVVDIDLIPLLVSTLDQDATNDKVWEYWFQYVGRLRSVLIECDQVITTNEYLGSYIHHLYGKPTQVVKNFYNKAQEHISSLVLQNGRRNSDKDDFFDVGYFSGSPSHNLDFEIASAALLQIMNEYKQVRLVISGYLELGNKFKTFKDRIERRPMMNFGPLQASIGSVDLNLTPLQDNIFTRCKSELKFFEAALVHTPTLASGVGMFSKSIDDGKSGWLAKPEDWFHALQSIIELHRFSREEFSRIGVEAKNSSECDFSYKSARKYVQEMFGIS